MHEGGDFFRQNLLDKDYFVVKMTGPAMVRLASSDFWKAPQESARIPFWLSSI